MSVTGQHDDKRPSAAETASQGFTQEATEDSSLKFNSGGNLPPVFTGAQMAMLSASERAYGNNERDNDGDELSAKGRIMADVAEDHSAAIEEASKRYGVPEVDIMAVITQESRGVATANAGRSQRDGGRHAASGLMQVTEGTWKSTTARHSELSKYGFAAFRYNPRINILVGTAALKDKREALEALGVPCNGPDATSLTIMAFNAGEGIVSAAYHAAVDGGARNPAHECLQAQYLKPAIAKYPSVYSYYLTGGGKKRNPTRSVQKAIDLKFQEISKYPTEVQLLIAEATEHQMATTDVDQEILPPPGVQLANDDRKTNVETA